MPTVRAIQPDQRAIDALPSRKTKYEISVLEHRGLVVRVRPNGAKKFVYRSRQGGRLRRVALRATDLGGAVREWAAIRRDARFGIAVASGADGRGGTGSTPPDNRAGPTVAQLLARYVEERARPDKQSWRKDYAKLVRYVLPAWGGIEARTLRRGDVHALVGYIAAKRPLQANRVLGAIRRLFAFAIAAGLLEAHACVVCPMTHCVVTTGRTDAMASASAECASDRRPGAAAVR
jgi:hypothetical protein